jgi:transposase
MANFSSSRRWHQRHLINHLSQDFEDFIEQLLPFMGTGPEPKSVLAMDNASIHHTERIEQMCRDAGVKLVYLLPYSPDLNLIEEFFVELKAFIK